MEIPNARILEDGEVRFGATQALPYRWYYGGMGILPRLEFTGRLTEITNIPALSKEYGAYKDKAGLIRVVGPSVWGWPVRNSLKKKSRNSIQ